MTREESTIVYLNLTSWIGISVGASHFMGSLSGNKDKWEHKAIRLEKTLNKSEAIKENKLARKIGMEKNLFLYEEGDIAERWLDKDKLVNEAIKVYKTYFPNARLLIEGSSSALNPQQVLDCSSKDDMLELNQIYEKYELNYLPNGEWKDKETAKNCCNQWDKIIEKYK